MKKEFTHIERKGLPGGPNEMFTYVTGVFSTEGYKRNSPDVSNPFNIIPSGSITMKDVDFPVMGTDNLGNSEMMMPGNDYQFPGDQVFEVPMAQTGFEVPKRQGVRLNYDAEGNVIGESTHIMKAEIVDGKWYGFPTLFQNEDGTWNDTYEKQINLNKKDWMPAFEEAKKRGEVIEFGTDKEAAIKFGEGSWKPKMKRGGGLLDKTMKCNDCGWSWKAADGGNDVSTCHKCGGSALPKAQDGKESKTIYINDSNDPRRYSYSDSAYLHDYSTAENKWYMDQQKFGEVIDGFITMPTGIINSSDFDQWYKDNNVFEFGNPFTADKVSNNAPSIVTDYNKIDPNSEYNNDDWSTGSNYNKDYLETSRNAPIPPESHTTYGKWWASHPDIIKYIQEFKLGYDATTGKYISPSRGKDKSRERKVGLLEQVNEMLSNSMPTELQWVKPKSNSQSSKTTTTTSKGNTNDFEWSANAYAEFLKGMPKSVKGKPDHSYAIPNFPAPRGSKPLEYGIVRPFVETESLDRKEYNPTLSKNLNIENVPEIKVNPSKELPYYQRTGFNSGLQRIQPSNYDPDTPTWRGEPFQMDMQGNIYQSGGSLPKAQDGKEYTVESGNTFDGIANKKEVSKNLLRNMNLGIDYNDIKVGQVINVPDIKTKEERMQFFSDRRNTPMDAKDSPGISKIQTAISNGSTKQENPSYNKDILIDLSKVDKKELSKQQAERRQSLFNAANTVASVQGNNKDLEKLLVMSAVMENTLGIDDDAYGRNYTRGPMSIDNIAYKDLFEIRKGATKYTTQQKKNTAWLESLGINTSDIDSALRSDDPLTSMAVARLVYGRAPEALPSGDDPDALYNYYLKYYNKTGVDKYGGAEAHRDRFNDYYSEIYKELGGEVDEFQVYANYINGSYNGTEMETKAEKIYDKLNRVYYRKAKALDMSAPNYIMSNIINRSGQ